MLSDEIVRTSLEEADIVTVCIGANDILGAALANLESYINNGNPTLDYLDGVVGSNIATLNDDSSPMGYTALFNEMYNINPNAQYVFMTIYNPIKYLWLEDGKNGFFKPIFGFINDYLQLTILGFEVDEYLGDELLKQSMVRTLFNRVNGLGDWAEKHLRNLNEVLKNKIDIYQTTHPNFMLVNSKPLFESYPDRPVSANKHYNDLLNIEYTRGYNTVQMDWGKLWGDNSVSGYWSNLARHLWNGFDVGGFATELVTDIVTRVVIPDVDPHPKTYGHNVLYRLFAEALGWQNLEKRHYITFNPNGGNGSSRIQEISYIGDIPYFANLDANEFTRSEGYRFIGWNTKPDGSGISYSDRQTISMSSDITLYAQWSNIYTLRFKHSNQTNSMGNDETGHKECYALLIADNEMPDFGKFNEGSTRDYSLVYGTRVKVIAKHYIPDDWLTALTYTSKECRVLWNDTTVASGVGEAIYEFSITCDTTVDFRWKLNATTSGLEDWEDCHITTSLI